MSCGEVIQIEKVKREHACFLLAMFITVIASHATMIVDAAVGGNLLGSEAVSAVELAMPVYDLFFALAMMFGMGACTAASLAYGRGDICAVRRYFTGAMASALAVMLLLSAIIFLWNSRIIDLLCGDSSLSPLTQRYLLAMIPYCLASGIRIVSVVFTAMVGHPMRVMCCALVQFAVNLSCNLLLIGGMGLGIEALAYSSLFATVISLSLLLPVYLDQNCPFRIIRCNYKKLLHAVIDILKYGGAFMTVTIAYIIMASTTNSIVLRFLGEDAHFCWAVVMMVYLSGDFASSSASETSLSLGGRYLGAGDKAAAKLVYNRSMFFVLIWIALILAAIFILPNWTLPLFGASNQAVYPMLMRWLLLSIPFTVGTNAVCFYLVRLIQNNAIIKYILLYSLVFLAVPAVFIFFHWLCPNCEKYAFLALLPVQAIAYFIAAKIS